MQGIIQIASCRRIDGKDASFAEVAPALLVRCQVPFRISSVILRSTGRLSIIWSLKGLASTEFDASNASVSTSISFLSENKLTTGLSKSAKEPGGGHTAPFVPVQELHFDQNGLVAFCILNEARNRLDGYEHHRELLVVRVELGEPVTGLHLAVLGERSDEPCMQGCVVSLCNGHHLRCGAETVGKPGLELAKPDLSHQFPRTQVSEG